MPNVTDQTFTVPNVFSPNGDGINDFFQVNYQYFFTDFTIRIFNKWGKVVFESNSLTFEWDGRHNGKVLPEGTYAYTITGLLKRNGTFILLK